MDSNQHNKQYYIEPFMTEGEKDTPEKIDHIGIAVEDIDTALSFYTESLGLTLEGIEHVFSEGVRVAFLKIGQSRIELLEPLDNASAIRQFLDKKGEGVHHIALEVSDIKTRLAQLQYEGVPLIDQNPKTGAHNSLIAFMHPKPASHVLFELCEHDREGDG